MQRGHYGHGGGGGGGGGGTGRERFPPRDGYQGGGGSGGGGSQRGVYRPLEVTTGIINHLDRRIVDGTAVGSKRACRTFPLQMHPAWRRLQAIPRDEMDWLTSGVTNALVSSSGRQKRIFVQAMGWSLDGRRLVTANNEGSLTGWSGLDFSHFQTMEGQHNHEGNKMACTSLAWLNDGASFITADEYGTIHYFEWTFTAMMNTLCPSPGMAINSLSVAPAASNLRFVSGGVDKKLRVWDWALYKEELTMEGHIDRINCVDWHPRFAMMASASKDNTVRLWDPRSSDKCLATLQHHKSDVMKCAWNPINGNWLLTCSKDQTLRLFDIRQSHEPVEFVGHDKDVYSMAWHPTHERLFASGGVDGALAFWGVGTGNTPKVIIRPDEKEVDINPQSNLPYIRPIYEMAWHPLGHCLATGSRDQTVKFWCRKGVGHAMLSTKHHAPPPPPKPSKVVCTTLGHPPPVSPKPTPHEVTAPNTAPHAT